MIAALIMNSIVTKLKDLLFFREWSETKRSGKISIKEPDMEKTALRTQIADSEIPKSEIKRTVKGSVVTFEGIYQGKPIRVRILGGPVQEQ
jgi:hypothetical protein